MTKNLTRKMQDRKMQDQSEVTLLGAVAISLAVLFVDVSATLPYFITTSQNHIRHCECNVINNNA